MKYLSESYLSQYRNRQPNWGPIGELVYLRTYSRWLDGVNRRENWDETVTRTVEWSMGLHLGDKSKCAEESKELFDMWWNLKGFPAGRSLWVGGTDYASNFGFGQFNCSFLDIRSPQDFAELAYILMSGAGVGFRVTSDNIAELNTHHGLIPASELHIEPYQYVGAPGLLENTNLERHGNDFRLIVGDSRKGWAEAVKQYIAIITGKYGSYNKLIVNVDYVRPFGTRLKTFGGKASGPEPMIAFFSDAHRVLYADNRGWTSVKVLDVCNMIGRMVVAGGSRRSAQIALGDADDKEYIAAKTGNWYEIAPWRAQSNNSVIFKEKPTREQLQFIFEHIMQYGEPGFVNEVEAKKRHPNFRGINPCAEILLDSNGLCNLTTLNLMTFVKQETKYQIIGNGVHQSITPVNTYTIDYQALEKAIRLQARHSLRVTNVELELPNWDKIQKRDRLLGMSFTGFGDLVDTLQMTKQEQRKLLQFMRKVAHKAANEYADEMGINRPLLSTTVKPEGTLTQLPGVSSGVHDSFGPYFIRRIRISEADAVAQALIKQGFSWERDYFNHNTLVFSFPIKTPASKYAYSKRAIDMLERYKLVMNSYVDHNASITVYVDDNEVDGVIDWLLKNWNSYVAVSFLKKSNATYKQMPYEAITKEQYLALSKTTPRFDRRVLEAIEGSFAATELEDECVTGACPIR